jgi:cytoplasmic iron level regulating protein YaaA (DUF328/UPF0246 family)
MLFLLSPAKKLDYDSPVKLQDHTQPLFVKQSALLIDVLKKKPAADIAALMSLSDTLAELNVERYASWKPKFTQSNSRQAALAFNGDVYGGLQAATLTAAQMKWAQEHVAILSGLYGVLRPLDLMQPYRLEMGTKLETPRGKNLYQFWGTSIADYLNERLEGERKPVIVNIASDEYFKSVDLKTLKARVVQCVFQEWHQGAYKIISFNAKRARGLMARYAIVNKVATPEKLRGFDYEGYAYDAKVSQPDKLVFRRRMT